MSKLFTNTDNRIITAIESGESAADFIGAEYKLFQQFTDTPIVTKTLGAGIEVDGTEFVTTITKTELTTAGIYYHQFTVTDSSNNKLPPIFSGDVKVEKVK